MPTVAHVLDFAPNGARTFDEFLISLAKALRDRGWKAVYSFSAAPTGGFAERLADADADWLVSPAQPTVREAITLGRRLRPYAPDIIQTMFMSKFHPSILALKLVAGAPFLITADHTGGSVRTTSALGRAAKRLRGLITGLYTDRFIAVSEFIRLRDVRELYLPDRKMRVVYNGVDIERYAPREPPAHVEVTVVFVGRLIPEKGLLTLLRALVSLARDGLAIKLRIAGEGEQEVALRRFCSENGLIDRVEFLGHIDWVADLMRAADIVVVPSEIQEACALVIFEAMACGGCLVVSDVGGNPEIVGAEGKAGLVFHAGDAEDLAGRLRDLAANPAHREAMRRSARERVAQCFTLQKMVEGYIEVCRELAE